MRSRVCWASPRLRLVAVVAASVMVMAVPAAPAIGTAPEAGREGSGGPDARPPSLKAASSHPIEAYRGELPLGDPHLEETRTEHQIADDVSHTRIVRGEDSEENLHTIDLARTDSEADARALATELRRDGYRPRVDPVPAPMDSDRDVQLWLVRVGAAPEAEGLDPLLDRLAADGYDPLGVTYLPWTGGPTSGPWEVHILEIGADALADGRVTATLAGGEIRGTATIPEIAEDHDAAAIANAGFFVTSTQDGTLGQLAGISMVDGDLVSEAVDGRTSLVLPEEGEPVISALSTELTVTNETGAQRHIDGLNRMPGLIRSCGGVGDQPTNAPRHDFTCTDDSELIQFTTRFGDTTEAGDGAEAVLDDSGTVVEVRDERGGSIPEGGTVLSATGDAVGWLEAHAAEGAELEIEARIDAADADLPEGTAHIANGGPRLVTDGDIDVRAATEGFDWPDDRLFHYNWVFARHPRTLAGLTAEGDLLLVLIDGRGDHSVGANLRENARVLQSLGAEQGVNLDGGGSTLLMIGDEVVNVPSDRNPYRPVADALLIHR